LKEKLFSLFFDFGKLFVRLLTLFCKCQSAYGKTTSIKAAFPGYAVEKIAIKLAAKQYIQMNGGIHV
jgi:hypothetical protein